MDVPDTLVEFGVRLAESSGDVIRNYFRVLPPIGEKADSTPVTIADKEAEEIMRGLISQHYPEHGIIGEEAANLRENAEYVWVLDPIDGTKNYASGSYNFGTLIGLQRDNIFVLGIISQPVLGELWLGVKEKPTIFNGKPIETRSCDTLSKAWMYSSNPAMFRGNNSGGFDRLAGSVKHSLFGSDCIGYGLLAAGHIDIVCEAQLRPWDYAAHVPIVEGAGGVISDWFGNPLTLESSGTVLACGDRRAHKAALKILNQ